MENEEKSEIIMKTFGVVEEPIEGTISGIVSTESVDEEGDVVLQSGLQWHYYDQIGGPLLDNHNTNAPTGKCVEHSFFPDTSRTFGKFQMDSTSEGISNWQKANNGSKKHFSIGFSVVKSGNEKGWRNPSKLDKQKWPEAKRIIIRAIVREVSLVTLPMNAECHILEVKSIEIPEQVIVEPIVEPVINTEAVAIPEVAVPIEQTIKIPKTEEVKVEPPRKVVYVTKKPALSKDQVKALKKKGKVFFLLS